MGRSAVCGGLDTGAQSHEEDKVLAMVPAIGMELEVPTRPPDTSVLLLEVSVSVEVLLAESVLAPIY